MKLSVKKKQTDQSVIRQAKPFKRRFDTLLRHVKLILINSRDTLPDVEWQQLVDDTRASVLMHSAEYLGENLPDKKTTTEAIHMVFDGFLQDIHIRKVQAFRNRRV